MVNPVHSRRNWLTSVSGLAVGLGASHCLGADRELNSARSADIETQIKGSVGRIQSIGGSKVSGHAATEADESLENFHILESGSSSRKLKSLSTQKFPVQKMHPGNHQRVNDVIDDISTFRRLPKIQFACDHQCYDYFISHPDAAVSIWRAMNLSEMKLTQSSQYSYTCDADDGTSGILEYTLLTSNTAIAYSEGEFKSPFLTKAIKAKGIFSLYFEKSVNKQGMQIVTHHADVFVRFPSPAIEATARLITPISNMIADANFREISKFVYSISIAMQQKPAWMQQLATRMKDVKSKTRDDILVVSSNVFARHQQELQTASLNKAALETM